MRTMPWEPGVFLRVFEPGIAYRQESFLDRDAIYIANPDCVFIVVRQDSTLGPYPELAWLFREEVRILATIALSVPEGHGMIAFKPGPRESLNVDPCTPLHIPALTNLAQRNAKKLLAAQHLAAKFELSSWAGYDEEFDDDLFDGIDLHNDLMVRGLYCLLKGARLMEERDFSEEAVMNIQIAREASLELIREQLMTEGNNNPSFADAHRYITENFVAGRHLADFFRREHDLWVTMKHPKSNFGPVWIPPLMADDFYDTYSGLVSVYRHLITGEPGSATLDVPEEDI